MYTYNLLIFIFALGPRNQIVMRNAETQLRHILTLIQQLYYGVGRAICDARGNTEPPSNLRHFLGHFNALPEWISR